MLYAFKRHVVKDVHFTIKTCIKNQGTLKNIKLVRNISHNAEIYAVLYQINYICIQNNMAFN